MTEDEARAWLRIRYDTAAISKLALIAELVCRETANQNLVAASTVERMWSRHIVDSVQLLSFVGPDISGRWIDIGSGAGFPGLVIATLKPLEVTLVEPRSRRAEFLHHAINVLGLTSRVTVADCRVQDLRVKAAVVSARAVAPVMTLLEWAAPCNGHDTLWIMPKGKSAAEEVVLARQKWHGVFHVERSITDERSGVVWASGVSRR